MKNLNTGISLRSIVNALSRTVDLVNDNVTRHHERVAFISYIIGKNMNLDSERLHDLVTAAAMHDIGALSQEEDGCLIHHKIDENVEEHAESGFMLLKDFEPFHRVAEIIKYHHHQWNDGKGHLSGGSIVPFEGHIIHLADSIDMLVNKNLNILVQKDRIIDVIKSQSGFMFAPEAVDAWIKSASSDYFWLELEHADLESVIESSFPASVRELNFYELTQFAKIISFIIDFRSPYTAAHSSGVAEVSFQLGRLFELEPHTCEMLRIAGYLHDLGKIAITPEILEKNGKLTEDEFAVMRSHSYHSYKILNEIEGLEQVAKWAAYHHERIDGSGYPFGLKGNELCLGSKIVAVADVFTALTEDRPYRRGLPLLQAKKILDEMVFSQKLDREVAFVLFENITEVYKARKKSQVDAINEYLIINKNRVDSKCGLVR
jgi:HD-GYP domain-containing protein (c-di-GMP phosphodiesterase class II)